MRRLKSQDIRPLGLCFGTATMDKTSKDEFSLAAVTFYNFCKFCALLGNIPEGPVDIGQRG